MRVFCIHAIRFQYKNPLSRSISYSLILTANFYKNKLKACRFYTNNRTAADYPTGKKTNHPKSLNVCLFFSSRVEGGAFNPAELIQTFIQGFPLSSGALRRKI
jgi:hypothetical protein